MTTKTKTRIEPALAWTNIELDIRDEDLPLLMGRPNFVDGPLLGKIKDELQSIFFDLTDDGVELKITYYLNSDRDENSKENYITFLAHLEYPIYLLDRIDVEEYALSLIQERGLPEYVHLLKLETTNELESPLKAMSLAELLKKDFNG